MNFKLKNKGLAFFIFAIFSFLAGGLNGFLGTGGGIVFVILLSLITKNEQKDNLATTLCATLPISMIGLIYYIKSENVDFSLIGKILVPSIVGGVVGAILVDRLSTRLLNLIFSLLIIYSGFRLIFQ